MPAKPPSKDQVLGLLSRHIGAEAGITAEAIAAELDTLPRTVRGLISELRREGVAICAHPTTGYYVAHDAAEVERTVEFLTRRALHSLALAAKLRNIPLPELLGQLRLPT